MNHTYTLSPFVLKVQNPSVKAKREREGDVTTAKEPVTAKLFN